MKKKILYVLMVLAAGASFTSCDDFLDTLPDNRTTIDTEEKVKSILTSAYPDKTYALVTELMSDNSDNYGESNPYTDRFVDQVYAWEDVTEGNNDSPEDYWEVSYNAIANANLALDGIEEMGGATTTSLKEEKAEALLCRAYNHFILVNLFSKAYNSQTSTKDAGIPYISKTSSELMAQTPRGTVAETYEKIDKDIQEALPLVGDSHLEVPKYHFNTRAAYAFATRFYLYYEKWDKAVEYATKCLGSQPKTMLRDWKAIAGMTQTYDAVTNQYIDAGVNCNLMLNTAVSSLGLAFGPYRVYSKYAHGSYVASHEDGKAGNIWGSASFYSDMKTYTATNLDKTIFWKMPYKFEFSDPVAQIGYRRTVITTFTTDECLLNRAEAYIMLKKYDEAAADLTLWMQNMVNTNKVLTPENITEFYKDIPYSYTVTDDDPKGINSTIKKHLNPAFSIDAEGSTQECMLQCMLNFRRIETMEGGLRWFDIKRYGIEIIRRTMGANGLPAVKTDVLTKDDERRAIQIPPKVRDAGCPANPRKATTATTPTE